MHIGFLLHNPIKRLLLLELKEAAGRFPLLTSRPWSALLAPLSTSNLRLYKNVVLTDDQIYSARWCVN